MGYNATCGQIWTLEAIKWSGITPLTHSMPVASVPLKESQETYFSLSPNHSQLGRTKAVQLTSSNNNETGG